MATLNRTFSVKNGIDVANTIIVDSSRNLSNIVTANAVTVNANTYLTVAGLNLVDHTNNAYGQANTARGTANDAYGQANAAYAQANSNYQPAVTRLDVTNSGTSAYRFDQYGAAVNNPTLYIRGGETLAFNLNNAGHPFAIRVSSGGSNYDTGLTHVSTAGVVTTGSSAQGKTSGTLYWKVPYELIGNTYVYQCTAHGGMVGNIVIEPPMVVAYAQANAAYLQANNAYAEANIKLNSAGGTITGNLNVANYIYANAFYSTNKNVVGPNLANTHGERLRLYDFEQAGHPNYAIGVEANHIWAGTDENNGGTGFKWYGNTTAVAVMRSNGTLQLSNTVEAKVIRANGTGTAIDASQGNVLTNQVTGTQFNFLNGIYTVSINGGGSTSNYTLSLPANTGVNGQALTTDGTGNLIWSSDAYVQANGAYAQANGAYAQANGAFAQANGAYAQANGAYAQANGAYAQANGAYDRANTAANTVAVWANDTIVLSQANVNFNNSATVNVSVTANAITGKANVALTVNNASFSSLGTPTVPLTLASNVNIDQDLTVTGNLFVLGNTTTVETSTLTVEDSLIKLALNNASDAVDIGFFGVYDTTKQTGLFRDASDGKYKLFTDYNGDLTANVITGAFNSATLVANVEASLINVTTSNVSTLIVTTDANILGNLTVTGTTNFANTSQYNAAVNMASTLNVTGNTSLTNVAVNGVLTISSSGEGLTVANANVTNLLTVSTLEITSNTVTTSSSGQVVLDKFPTAEYTSAKYFVQSKSGSDIHTTEIIIVQDATNVWITEYGSIQTGPTLGTFSADISSGDVRLLFNANNNVNTIRSVRYGIIP